MGGFLDSLGANAGLLLLLVIVLVVILAVITISMSLRLNRLTKRYKLFMKGKEGISLEKAMYSRFKELDRLTERENTNEFDLNTIKKRFRSTLTHYGIVKYDAFDDVGGKMSFALAMLDDDNTGFILDTIHSKDNCFLYLKEIVKGESYTVLSNEEIEALKQAISEIEAETEYAIEKE